MLHHPQQDRREEPTMHQDLQENPLKIFKNL